MIRMTSFFLILAATAVFHAAASAAVVTVGSYDSGNCYPFSCFASDGSGSTYQQIYDAGEFSGPLYINAISFFLDDPGDMDTADYRIKFSTTSKTIGGLDSTWANNIGADEATFGTFSVSGAMPAVLTFVGTPFYYDPSMGNLLMQVDVLALYFANPYESFFQADYTGVVTQRLYAYGGSATGVANATGALVTQFDFSPATNGVPEPASLGLFGACAIGATVAAARRRNAKG
jgi:hypothetical protein